MRGLSSSHLPAFDSHFPAFDSYLPVSDSHFPAFDSHLPVEWIIFQLCFSLLYDHRCAAACHHEHRSALSYGFVVEVDAYDGVAAEALGTLRHFAHG